MSTISVQTSSRRLLSKKLILILKHFRIQLQIRRHIKRKFTEISRSRNFVSRKCSFSRKYWYSKHFRENVNENFRSRNKIFFRKNLVFFAKKTFSKYIHVLAVFFRLPISRLVQPTCLHAVLSQLSGLRCPVPDVLSKMSCPRCPVQDVLS
jgi:hypothetical protein